MPNIYFVTEFSIRTEQPLNILIFWNFIHDLIILPDFVRQFFNNFLELS